MYKNNVHEQNILISSYLVFISGRYFSSLEGNCARSTITFPSNRRRGNISKPKTCRWVDTVDIDIKEKNIYMDTALHPTAPSHGKRYYYEIYQLDIS